jgi:hypothetical protein
MNSLTPSIALQRNAVPPAAQAIELYHPKSNPGMLIPRLFLSGDEVHKMMPSHIRVVRTLSHDFGRLCDQMHRENAKVIIQEVPDEAHWKVHVIKDGRVGTCLTVGCNLVEALLKARSCVGEMTLKAFSGN